MQIPIRYSLHVVRLSSMTDESNEMSHYLEYFYNNMLDIK